MDRGKTVTESAELMFSRSGVGYVYCLSNPAMPGLVKIGYTNRSSAIRAAELSFGTREFRATGVPLPFAVVKDWQVPAEKAESIEQQIHHYLREFRVPSHGRVQAKEFFYLEPGAAIIAIEGALKELDWWAVSQAEKVKFDEQVYARAQRTRAAAASAKAQSDRAVAIDQEIAKRQAQWKENARLEKQGDNQIAGLKWGAIWFVGSWLAFGAMGAKDAIGWLCLIIGALAYYLSKDGPAQAYLLSQEATAALAKIEDGVRRSTQFEPIDFHCVICKTELSIAHAPVGADSKIRCMACKSVFPWRGKK